MGLALVLFPWFFLTLFAPADTDTDTNFLALRIRNRQIANPFARMIVQEVAKEMRLPVPKEAEEKKSCTQPVHPSKVAEKGSQLVGSHLRVHQQRKESVVE